MSIKENYELAGHSFLPPLSLSCWIWSPLPVWGPWPEGREPGGSASRVCVWARLPQPLRTCMEILHSFVTELNSTFLNSSCFSQIGPPCLLGKIYWLCWVSSVSRSARIPDVFLGFLPQRQWCSSLVVCGSWIYGVPGVCSEYMRGFAVWLFCPFLRTDLGKFSNYATAATSSPKCDRDIIK